jgi:hypothetical protein
VNRDADISISCGESTRHRDDVRRRCRRERNPGHETTRTRDAVDPCRAPSRFLDVRVVDAVSDSA